MKKYDNFCSALSNMKQIYKYSESFFYPMFCELKEEIDSKWL